VGLHAHGLIPVSRQSSRAAAAAGRRQRWSR
jgi:hypothetical protein